MGPQSNARRPTTQVDSEPDPATPVIDGSVDDPTPPLRERGDAIGRYVVVDVIGHGGMGVVYSAWDPQLDRRIALKLVTLSEGSGGGNATQGELHRVRLLREAQALARIEHAHVVRVHDVGVCRSGPSGAIGEEQVFIAMEFIAGQSLRDWIRASKRGLAATLEVFLAAGRGLAAAHAGGLVHRDFKPDNVLVGHAGEVKVVDFGLARDNRNDDRPRTRDWADTQPAVAAALGRVTRDRSSSTADGIPETIEPDPSAGYSIESVRSSTRSLQRSSTGSITATGTILGTPAYMAPEQHARATVDARSDQYAFCLSLWEALYGKRPFSGRKSEVLAARKRKLEIRESSRGLRVPKWLRSTLLRGLSADPRQRFEDMGELLAELEGGLAARRRRRVPAALLGAGAMIAAIVVGVQVLAKPDSPTTCTAPSERLVGVWDESRRAEVERALTASKLAYATDTWVRVAQGLDAYRFRWLAAEVEACEATHVRHEHDGAWLEQRLACLDERRREFASLTEQLARSDARTVEHAAREVGSLAPISACESERGPSDLTPLPSESHLRLRVEHQLDRLADARAQLNSGHLAEGLAAAREVRASDAAHEWPALAAEAEYVIANLVADVEGDRAGERAGLHSAASLALRSGHRRLAASSWLRLARLEVRGGAGPEQAARWLAYAEGLAAVLDAEHGADPPLAADLEHTRAQLRFHTSDFAGAEVHARARLELLREFYGPDNPRIADGLNNLGVTVYMQHRKDEAVAAYTEALAVLERVQGPEHPSVANMHNNIGVVSTDRQLFSEALIHYRRAVEIRARVFPPGHELVAQSLVNLANLHLFASDHGPGIAPALETLLADGAPVDEDLDDRARLELVPDYLRLGRLLAGAGEHHNALVSFSGALALLDTAPDARLPPGFEPPSAGQPWPAHLDGCRADLLLGVESSARALGRDLDGDRAEAERLGLAVASPAWPRRCLEELSRWVASREQ